jgi:cytochrome c oxidase subunit 3
MSSVTTISDPHAPDAHGNGHDAHLAHHFDTPEQQQASGKLGMWVFLATEILMFGGLFCAYSVYRHNHPEVFEYAHQWLNKKLGAINTVVLITSSLTMAWGVRLAQLGKTKALILCLVLTIIGGYGFMAIKSIEYNTKYDHQLGFGPKNMYRPVATKGDWIPGAGAPATGEPKGEKPEEEKKPEAAPAEAPPQLVPFYTDPNAGTPDAAKFHPVAVAPAGLAPKVVEAHKRELTTQELEEEYQPLSPLDKERTYTFFQIYFLMTGLHGIHVLVGMALIFWILVRAVPRSARRGVKLAGLGSIGVFLIYVGILIGSHGTWIIGAVTLLLAIIGAPILRKLFPKPIPATPGEFTPAYFAPVDIVGLYWHLVDLIWIFLFPLLYLIR